ncbi:50S ribosomal protein L21 [Candidatus Wolfebacteria bacterium CG18_big_fil_WC_8_21_14_2_50_39_7]|uniref:Large ribosomal subunit protein bL21 n=5 Tax=Candidatus Wolfeibacteriota TaxID=1752735 RepID=A0A2M7Q789_9BACT|nr:50S ribosomal protein L21 [Candidatus Wolfebacteria bacterium]OIO64913.1 MAG: 50S ribosomal protein L21 [Candidatus Wolfebacteria bacterium CG1_02_39_135]PIP92401.1 MAG: 50S ribosomal protein L21 [Candidatus Wolfebacteria bacterium CG18_big_fil_WC_8_21_14_2_50_39_7]PIU98716.1 MAG: 50S ribosomal protein L21 [Candidatus Wolfebacteria bacterium CG03_land_8_20_14_0_80_39_317]PIY58982.1 MAG: 50S ribosomal protein L21 [Candidatus Wolfebacteria bacterium CG_4_10_14_0_8_um_filter_39_64]PJB83700.1 M
MSKFAIIQTGGKQYRVSPGQKVKIEKIEGAQDAILSFDKVLLIGDGDNIKVGTPYVEAAKVEAKILKQGRDKKKIVFRYHSKTRYRKKKGHRQHFTEVEILNLKS